MLQAFLKPWCDHVTKPLTTGARALTKHWHRDGTENWWGCAGKGSNEEKNAAALKPLRRIIQGATWSNIHELPADDGDRLVVFETRQGDGYGARWQILPDGSLFFRGFLEPQMQDGHANKWRH